MVTKARSMVKAHDLTLTLASLFHNRFLFKGISSMIIHVAIHSSDLCT